MFNAIKFWVNPAEFIKSDIGKSRLQKRAKKVYKKFKYTCQKCGYKAGDGDIAIEDHHIYPKSIYPKYAYKLWNSACLCEKCHRTDKDSLHKSMKREECNPKSFNKWLNKSNKKDSNIGFNISMGLIIVVLVVLILESLGVIG